jgi:PKD repeat protein
VGHELFAAGACVALGALACGGPAGTAHDASMDGVRPDVASPLSLSISVTGCAWYDPSVPLCAGQPPLALSFAPVGSQELIQFAWTFGDGTPTTTERAPSHSYAHFGRYNVTVKAGTADMGSVMPPSPLIVRVEALATGAPCDVDEQCASGLTCTCADGSGCAPAFTHGLCSAACDTAGCQTGAVCAAIALAPGDGGPAAPLCLASCETAACAAGFACRTLPTGGLVGSTAPSDRWTRGCLPLGLVRDVGASCRDANEALSDDVCSTGWCADVGALGVCSASCDDTHPCPSEASCARLVDGRQLCLTVCGSDGDCGGDPLIACAQTPTAGAGGATVSVCAPRRCANDNACPTGRCGPDGFCVRQ